MPYITSAGCEQPGRSQSRAMLRKLLRLRTQKMDGGTSDVRLRRTVLDRARTDMRETASLEFTAPSG